MKFKVGDEAVCTVPKEGWRKIKKLFWNILKEAKSNGPDKGEIVHVVGIVEPSGIRLAEYDPLNESFEERFFEHVVPQSQIDELLEVRVAETEIAK